MATSQLRSAAEMVALCSELQQSLAKVLLADEQRFRRRLKQLRRDLKRSEFNPAKMHQRLSRVQRAIEGSLDICQRRQQSRFRVAFSEQLPFSQHIDAIGELFDKHQVLIVTGATGSGKSTQLPKLCLQHGRGIRGRIGHTQPRRIAARAIAARIAEETATEPGSVTGYSVRFDDKLATTTRVKVMTDGILLNEIDHDPKLLQYDTIIVDEVHERSLNIDFLLGHLKRILALRRDLKLIITSATLATEQFEDFFDDVAVFDIEGRSYPIETRYCPPEGDAGFAEVLGTAITELDEDARGDILVFLPGEREIREARKALQRLKLESTEVLTLYARLSAAQQARIFHPGELRRIVLATNVAETSLTVPRVKHVIDSGLARVSRYSPRRKLQQLPIEKIAQANADQRRGRCGREQAGICIRLYDEADFASRPPAMTPEILRTNLAGVILRLKAAGIEDIEHFPFAERPEERQLKDGYNVLQEIGALDAERKLTRLGRQVAEFPIDPRLARVLVEAGNQHCVREVLMIVAALSISDPRERPNDQRDLADRAHSEFADKRSDFLWFVNAFVFARELDQQNTGKRWRQCRKRFLSANRMQEWVMLHDYLARRAERSGLVSHATAASYKQIHLALITGFPSLVGEWQGEDYLGCRNLRFNIHPSSALHKRNIKWILAGDMVETSRPFARLAARIDARWVEQAAPHLIRRSYDAPHWDKKLGTARVTEIQRLFGLVLNAERLVELRKTDTLAARAALINVGLLEFQLGQWPDFLRNNRRTVRHIQDLEARARRRDLLATDTELYAFYDQRIPATICTRKALLRWLRADSSREQALTFALSDASHGAISEVSDWLFPSALTINNSPCKLSYCFEPGSEQDGVSVFVPLALLPAVEASDFDRLVPGLLSEKLEALLRGLPKTLRRQFSPLREYTMAALEALDNEYGELPQALARVLERMSGVKLSQADFAGIELAAHHLMRIVVIDTDGEPLQASRNLGQLRARYGMAAENEQQAIDWGIDKRQATSWCFGDLPQQITTRHRGFELHAWIALNDFDQAVGLSVWRERDSAAAIHKQGVSRLLLLNAQRERRALLNEQRHFEQTRLSARLFGHHGELFDNICAAVAAQKVNATTAVRTAAEFEALLNEFRTGLFADVCRAAQQLQDLFDRAQAIRRSIDDIDTPVSAEILSDINAQLAIMLGPGVITDLLNCDKTRIERYLRGLERRVERLAANPGKDLSKLQQLQPLWQRFVLIRSAADDAERELHQLAELFEEFRLLLFAPEHRSSVKVSAALLNQEMAQLEQHSNQAWRAQA